jgi:hypothetical protein
LDVKVLEKDSGLLRFERAFLTATQLDQYCVYPFEPVGCRADGYGSFEMHQNYEQAPVSGEVSLTVLMSELTPARTELEMRSNWKAVFQGTSHYRGVYQLETKGHS